MALTIESILPTVQTKAVGETIEITTVASGYGGDLSFGENYSPFLSTDFTELKGVASDFTTWQDSTVTMDATAAAGTSYKQEFGDSLVSLEKYEIEFVKSTNTVDGFYQLQMLVGEGSNYANYIKLQKEISDTYTRLQTFSATGTNHNIIVPHIELGHRYNISLLITELVDLSVTILDITTGVSNTYTLPNAITASAIYKARLSTAFGITTFYKLSLEWGDLAYQYNKDGSPIVGATSNPYTKTAEVGDSGSYTCTVSDGVETVTSDAVSVVVNVPQTKNGTVEIDGTPVKFRSYTPSPLVSYKLKPMSNGSMRNVDRGLETDSFTTSATFRGTVDERDELLAILKNARDTRTPLTMENFAVPLFGDHVDYTNPITVYVVSQTVPTMADSAKTQSFTIVFKIDGQVDTSGDDTIPSLSCARYTTRGGYNQNAILLSSYTQAHSLIDMELDTPTFTGEYDMSPVDTARLLRFWRIQRGEAFQVSDLGTINPFGERFPAPYIVYIISVEVEPMFNNLRRVKLTLSLRS